jgi:hypothetical protein
VVCGVWTYLFKIILFILGESGHVLEVKCKKRTGSDNLISCMRKILANAFPTESIGLGGVFCAQKGQLKIHVMPEYSSEPLKSEADVENWLKFYKMDAPFTCYSVLVSKDPVRYNLTIIISFRIIVINSNVSLTFWELHVY